jgi:hypothetical protein
VKVILRSPTAAESVEIAGLEKSIANEAKVPLHEGKSREDSQKK